MQKIKQTTKSWLAALAAIGLAASCGQAATIVSGNVSGTWTQTGSPYVVVGDVLVSSLTISSNVEVRAMGDYVFKVTGSLTAYGTSNAPILFTATNGIAGWEGILFANCYTGSEMRYCRVEKALNSGVRCTNSNPTFLSCLFTNNSSPSSGGGILIDNTAYTDGVVRFVGCSFANNAADPLYAQGNAYGGGVYAIGQCSFDLCQFTSNTVSAFNCNGCWSGGGGLFLTGAGSLRNCTFLGNVANDRVTFGGGAFLGGGTVTVQNCIFAFNTTYIGGGAGLYLQNATATIANCSVVRNTTTGLELAGGVATVVNSILYFNAGGGAQIGGSPSVSYSDVQGVILGTGSITNQPRFVDEGTSLLHPTSPCIDAGNPAAAYNDTCFPPSQGGVRNDMGATGGPSACGWLAGDSPAIVEQPKSLLSCVAQSPSFTVTATGSVPLSYQWYFNGVILSGRTNASLTLTNVQKSQAGSYFVVVANVFGSLNSATNLLTVNDACIDLHMYAGLTIAGQSGSNYVLSYTTNVADTNSWFPLATNLMGGSNWFYVDMDSPFSPYRFYKAVLKP